MGKGSKSRPMRITQEEWERRFEEAFKPESKEEECEDNAQDAEQ